MTKEEIFAHNQYHISRSAKDFLYAVSCLQKMGLKRSLGNYDTRYPIVITWEGYIYSADSEMLKWDIEEVRNATKYKLIYPPKECLQTITELKELIK